MGTIFGIILIIVVLFFVSAFVDDARIAGEIQEKKRQKELENEEERKKFPPINWENHPLVGPALDFLVKNIDADIAAAKNIIVGRNGDPFIKIEVNDAGIEMSGIRAYLILHYYDLGYDKIKVGCTKEETEDACNDYAIKLVEGLREHYASETDVQISDVYYNVAEDNFETKIFFYVDLSKFFKRLKQI